jgi:hypothetical protein
MTGRVARAGVRRWRGRLRRRHADPAASGRAGLYAGVGLRLWYGGRDDALGVLAARFGARTAALVAAVTNPQYQPGRDEHQQYCQHVTASLEASPWPGSSRPLTSPITRSE